MAELADAHGSGPCESNFMQVQVLLPAPNENNPNLAPLGDGFGLLLFFNRYETANLRNRTFRDLMSSSPRVANLG